VKVKPKKGYRFRIILCDDQGNAVTDDFNELRRAEGVVRGLIPALQRKREHGEAVPEKED